MARSSPQTSDCKITTAVWRNQLTAIKSISVRNNRSTGREVALAIFYAQSLVETLVYWQTPLGLWAVVNIALIITAIAGYYCNDRNRQRTTQGKLALLSLGLTILFVWLDLGIAAPTPS